MDRFILFVAVLFLPCVISGQTVKANRAEFTRVHKIFVDADPTDTPLSKQLVPHLKKELTQRGFVVVDERADADAVLSHDASVIITLHGDANDPPDRAVYEFRLFLPDGRLLWKTTVRIVSRADWAENNKSGAGRFADKFYADWQKASKSSRR